MTVSVRMDPLLEQQLESAARQQGVTKSQFIVDAVQRALGHKDAYRVLGEVQREYGLAAPARRVRAVHDSAPEPEARRATSATHVAPGGDAWRGDLHARHDAAMADWLAYQVARKAGKTWSPTGDQASALGTATKSATKSATATKSKKRAARTGRRGAKAA